MRAGRGPFRAAAALCAGALLAVPALRAQPAQPSPAAAAGSPALAARLAEEGRTWLLRDDLVAARSTFRRLRAVAPGDPAGLLGLGKVHLEVGEPELALAYATAAEQRFPEVRAQAMALRVRALLRARRFETAVEVSTAALAAATTPDVELLAAHASALFRMQRNDEAAAVYRRVLALDPRNAEALVRLGSGLIEAPSVPRLPELERAVAAQRLGDLARAIELMDATVREHVDHPVAYRLLGEALQRQEAERSVIATAAEFAALADTIPLPDVAGLPAEKFMPGYGRLPAQRQAVATRAMALFSGYLPQLVTLGGRHDLMLELERTTEAPARAPLRGKRTFDGRVWDDVRGIGGLRAATGIEALDDAQQFGFDTLAHEIAHQAHLYAFRRADRVRVRELFLAAQKNERFLDYYAANNEAEFFGQGVEAFVSFGKRPGREATHGHTRFELYRVDRALHDFIARVVDFDPLRDPQARRRILPAAVAVALRCGRPEDAMVAAEMMEEGEEKARLLAAARRALLFARSY